MSELREYRVRWQREDRPVRSTILQTKRGALEKVERLKRIDGELSGTIDWTPDSYGPETHPLEGMPPLVAGPVVESRLVGPWEVLIDD